MTKSQLKSLAERVTKASADIEKAMTLVEAAKEECALAIEKPIKFYGSNLSWSRGSSSKGGSVTSPENSRQLESCPKSDVLYPDDVLTVITISTLSP